MNRPSSLLGQYSFNSSNELTASATNSYTYDSNGNMWTKTSGTNTTSYTWDFENRLSSVTLPGGGTESFLYDPFGRRIRKSWPNAANNTTMVGNYLYDGANIVTELNASGAVVASYTQGAGIDEPLAMRRGGYISYYHADGLGSVTSLTNTNAQPVATYVYDSFGNTTATEGIFNPFRYTGREQDPETGLYYYRARYYDSSVGRFLSEDPIGFLGSGTNFYAYVSKNSTNFIDPDGLCGNSPNNGTAATPTRPTNCGAAIALGAGSVGFDVLGMIPGLGNMISAGAAGGRIANGIAYAGAGYGTATGLHDEAPYGAASAGAGLGLTFADAAIAGGKVIPVLGNALSFATGLYDGYQLGKTISKCW